MAMIEHLKASAFEILKKNDLGEYSVPTHGLYPVQFNWDSADPEHPGFDPNRYWRGPVWLMINSLIGKGFAEIEESERAEKIRHDSLALVQQSGFCEYFNPLNGSGLGGTHFTWTAAVFLDWVLAL